ncbi:MAG TPA: cytochrome C oxidase subunit IV family protein [Gemmatimonadales bacterium]|nr:cytochrome C oxidase subunit IV family protein [Gemmatimonadales bacterium]
MAPAGTAHRHRLPAYVGVWLALVLIVGIEVQVTYARLPARLLLPVLLGLAVIEALLALLYFMHLRYERPLVFWSVISTLLFVLLMMNQFWADARRLLALHR